MEKRTHWEVKATLNEHTYTGFAVWCVEQGWTISNVLRTVALAAENHDKRLDAILKYYDAEKAKP